MRSRCIPVLRARSRRNPRATGPLVRATNAGGPAHPRVLRRRPAPHDRHEDDDDRAARHPRIGDQRADSAAASPAASTPCRIRAMLKIGPSAQDRRRRPRRGARGCRSSRTDGGTAVDEAGSIRMNRGTIAEPADRFDAIHAAGRRRHRFPLAAISGCSGGPSSSAEQIHAARRAAPAVIGRRDIFMADDELCRLPQQWRRRDQKARRCPGAARRGAAGGCER